MSTSDGKSGDRREAADLFEILDELAGISVEAKTGGKESDVPPAGDAPQDAQWVETMASRVLRAAAARELAVGAKKGKARLAALSPRASRRVRHRFAVAAAALLSFVVMAMTFPHWFWSGRNSAKELTYETAQYVVFDESREFETRYAAMGALHGRVVNGYRAVAAKLDHPHLGQLARTTLLGLQEMLTRAEGLPAARIRGDYAATMGGIRRGDVAAFAEITKAWREAISVMVRAQALHPRFVALLENRTALHLRRLEQHLR